MVGYEEILASSVHGATLRQRLLPVTRVLVAGESLSSWVVRIADLHGMSVQQLSSWLMGRGRQAFSCDVDRGAWGELLEAISIATTEPIAALRSATLQVYAGVLWGDLAPQGRARWVLPIVKRGTLRDGFGVQYCPICLATDAVPHLRLHWRLAFVVACERHGCLLQDRCDRCAAPVAPHRWRTGPLRELGSSGIWRCHGCGADRRDHTNPAAVHASVLEIQRMLLSALAQGGVLLDGQAVFGMAFFPGIAMLLSFLDDARESGRVWPVLQLTPPDFVRNSGARYGGFERQDVSARAELLRGLAAIWAVGFDEFLGRLAKQRVSSGRLLRYAARLRTSAPFWYLRMIKNHLDRSSYVPTDQEIDGAIGHLKSSSPMASTTIRQVCQLLGMATNSSARVASRLRACA